MHFQATSSTTPMAMNPNEPPKQSKRERFRAKAEALLHIKHDNVAASPYETTSYTANDEKELLKKAQELTNKKKDDKNGDKKENVALGALGALGPVAYAMWKKKKEKKRRKARRQGRYGGGNGEGWAEELEEEEEEEEEDDDEGSSGFQDFLAWIQDAFAE